MTIPLFGDEESKYTTIDMEMIACAPILSDDADIYGEDSGNLEAHGPFVPTFPTDAKKVWAILLACFGPSSAWQHIKASGLAYPPRSFLWGGQGEHHGCRYPLDPQGLALRW
jgi:hypothetical protein